MYLWWNGASSEPAPEPPSSAKLEIEVVTDAPLAAAPRRLTLTRGCFGSTAVADPGVHTFTGDRFEVATRTPDCHLVALAIAGETRVELGYPSGPPVRFDFRKVHLHGVVTRGSGGVAASLDFVPSEKWIGAGPKSTPASARSDGSGEYEAYLWPGVAYRVHVRPGEDGSAVSKFTFATGEDREQEKDFSLSANTLVVTVLDADSGEPIPEAKLSYIDGDGSQLSKVDSSGTVTIESVPAGPFHATAIAKGYVNAPADWTVEDRDAPQPLEIDMKPKSDGNDFQVLMPDGSSAGNARAYYRYDPRTHSHIFIPCDAEGTCHPGERPADAEPIVLSHDGAGLTVVPAGEIYETGSVTLWPSGGPLVLKLKPGPDSSAGCEGPVLSIRGFPVATDGSFACGDAPSPLEFKGLPAGEIDVTIVSKGVDDRGRFTPGVRLAGPIPVVLPSDPVDVELP